ncbi:ribonuclease P protein component [Burkholderiaceae bacterium UC74_6]
MIGRILRSADFERVLGRPSRLRSPHFAIHHLAEAPSVPAKPRRLLEQSHASAPVELSTEDGELSTGPAQVAPTVVDGAWLGAIVPKRNAKRAVTRNLLKRQIRAAFAARSDLPPGLWVVRLRAPIDRKQFVSAASDALRSAVREELSQLLGRIK